MHNAYSNEAEALAAVSQDGRALRDVPEDRKTAAVVLAAVSEAGSALQCVPEDLKTIDVVCAAVANDKEALHYLPDELRQIKEESLEKHVEAKLSYTRIETLYAFFGCLKRQNSVISVPTDAGREIIKFLGMTISKEEQRRTVAAAQYLGINVPPHLALAHENALNSATRRASASTDRLGAAEENPDNEAPRSKRRRISGCGK